MVILQLNKVSSQLRASTLDAMLNSIMRATIFKDVFTMARIQHDAWISLSLLDFSIRCGCEYIRWIPVLLRDFYILVRFCIIVASLHNWHGRESNAANANKWSHFKPLQPTQLSIVLTILFTFVCLKSAFTFCDLLSDILDTF